MMRSAALGLTAITMAALVGSDTGSAQQPGGKENTRFVAEWSLAPGGEEAASTVSVTFFGVEPSPDQAEKVLRNCLMAAAAVHTGGNITGKAWFSVSPTSTDRQPISLANGSDHLVYDSKAQSVASQGGAPATLAAEGAESAEGEEAAAITQHAEVLRSCEKVAPELMAKITAVGAEHVGSERKLIVKALRAWCKENGVTVDRALRGCLSAVSKAANEASGGSALIKPEDLADALARGKTAYGVGQCAKCHLGNGQGGPRGPDLTDGEWLHCDGSIEGIRKVLIAGVPQNKVKDPTRTFGMNPATNLISDDQQITDLAAYIHSISQP